MARKVLEEKTTLRKQVNRRIVAAAAPWFYAPGWKNLVINDDCIRVLCVDSYKSREDLNWGEAFIGLGGVNASVTFVMRRADGLTLQSDLSRTANDADGWSPEQVNMSYMDMKRKNFESEQASNAADLLIRANAVIFETYLYIGVHAPDEEQLEKRCKTVEQRLRAAHKTASPFAFNQDEMFFAASPFLTEDPYMYEVNNYTMPSTTIGQALFNREKGIADPSGIPLGNDLQQGRVLIDFMTRTLERFNSNIFISGESGAGKSTLMKHLILYFSLLYDVRIYINDIDGEYTPLVRALGGVVIDADRFTPFEPRNLGSGDSADENEDEFLYTNEEVAEARRRALQNKVLSTHLPFLTNQLMQEFKVSREDYSLLYYACELAHNRCGISNTMTFEEYYKGDRVHPWLKDVYDVVGDLIDELPEDAETLRRIRRNLMRGAVGAEAHRWAPAGDVAPEGDLVCVNFEKLSNDDDARMAQYTNILSWEWSDVRSHRYDNKIVGIFSDEIHNVVNKQNLIPAMMVKDMVQRIRKYGAFTCCATQMISEMLDGEEIKPIGEGIVYNSCYQFFGCTSGNLGDPTTPLARTQKLLQAPDEVMHDLANAEQGKFVVRVGKKQQSWVKLDKVEDWELELFGMGGGR